ARGLSRVADARAADFDGDGDLDIVVAMFGWRKTGSVLLLENRTKNWATPIFVPKVIDARTGSIHVPIVDLNGDGKPAFVALFAQTREGGGTSINTGKGLTSAPQRIYTAPHPIGGWWGIHLADLVRAGDEDVLLTHGETFDDMVVKP